MKKIDLTGQIFSRLTVISQVPRSYQTMWKCKCDCGKETIVASQYLRNGHTKSCGCYREELRPTYAKKRDFKGEKNPATIKSKKLYGKNYISSKDIWYKKANSVMTRAKEEKTKIGFSSAMELASYLKSIAPTKCPVFNKKFSDRGHGFNKWSSSVDKIDPKKGYVRGNIQIISMMANCMKRDATQKELIMFAMWIKENNKCN